MVYTYASPVANASVKLFTDIALGIFIPFCGLVVLLLIWRRDRFPLKAQNLYGNIAQVVLSAIFLIVLFLQVYIPCGAFFIVYSMVQPIIVSFTFSRV